MVFYCCGKVYRSILRVRNLHETFSHQPLNLVIRAKKTAVQNREASFVYEKQFNDQVISYALTIVLCKLSFRNISKLNKEQQRTCINHFDCDKEVFFVCNRKKSRCVCRKCFRKHAKNQLGFLHYVSF